MSSDVLRRAAALMRERAEAHLSNARANPEETGGPLATYSPAFIEDAFRKHAPVDPPYSAACEEAWETAGEHYASWHPAVALAVADWLDSERDRAEPGPDVIILDYVLPRVAPAALTAARTYLGETEPTT